MRERDFLSSVGEGGGEPSYTGRGGAGAFFFGEFLVYLQHQPHCYDKRKYWCKEDRLKCLRHIYLLIGL